MHGRVKVRTTEEERERKKKEQALKVRAYRAAMARIQKIRSTGKISDDEMLTLTMQILQRNPDVSTLWNIRRECVLAKIAELQRTREDEDTATQSPPPPPAEPIEESQTAQSSPSIEEQIQAIFINELSITEQCLMLNPKSYNSWHHRCWTLEQNPQADWQRELQLCNKYLKYDERNFHTWDYRRFVTHKAQVPPQQELDFCTEKIKVNFSNYSSWHHRSLLLPILYPYEGSVQPKRPMSEAKLKEELEMVLTAAFTDPNDSSAWFYQRWLLGTGAQQESPIVVAFRCGQGQALLAFNKSLASFDHTKVELATPEETFLLHSWTPIDSSQTTWRCSSLPDMAYSDKESQKELLVGDQRLVLSNLPPIESDDGGLTYFCAPLASASYTEEVLAELRTQLQSCLDLLDYEPDSKWTLLTSALLMRAIDAAAHHAQSLAHLLKLETVDALRVNYYRDLAARWSLEQLLTNWPKSADFPRKFDLTKEPVQLSSLPFSQYFVIADEIKLPETLVATSETVARTFSDFKS